MRHDRFEWLRRIKVVEREHSTIRHATDRLLDQFDRDPRILGHPLKRPDILNASKNLDGTYVIRLFAEFETALRTFWSSARGTHSPSRTRDLLDGIATSQRISEGVRTNALAVRDHRNALIHHRTDDAVPISVDDSRRHLCTFLSWLPPSW
jgi:hypothetical protein